MKRGKREREKRICNDPTFLSKLKSLLYRKDVLVNFIWNNKEKSNKLYSSPTSNKIKFLKYRL